MKKFILITLAFILISGLIFSGNTKGAPVQTLKIGALLSLTGFMTFEDAWEKEEVQVVAQMINDKGGLTIQGQKYNIEVVIEDCKSSFDGYTAAANKLILDHKVKFIVGPNAFFSLASTPILEANKILHVSGYNTLQPGEMNADTPYAFLGYDSPMLSNVVANLKALKSQFPDVKNIAICTADDASLKYVIPILKEQAKEMGLTIVGDAVLFPNETQDYSPFAAKLNAIAGADAYEMLLGAPPAGANILKGLRALGNKKPMVFNAYAPDIVNIAGPDAADNSVHPLSFTPGQPDNPPLLEEAYRKCKAGHQWFGCTPNALWILAQVIQAAGSLDPAAVKAKWESMNTVTTLYGKGTFGGFKTYGLRNHAVSHPVPYAKIIKAKVMPCGWIDPGPLP